MGLWPIAKAAVGPGEQQIGFRSEQRVFGKTAGSRHRRIVVARPGGDSSKEQLRLVRLVLRSQLRKQVPCRGEFAPVEQAPRSFDDRRATLSDDIRILLRCLRRGLRSGDIASRRGNSGRAGVNLLSFRQL